MVAHDRMKMLKELATKHLPMNLCFTEIHTYLGAYGGESLKPTRIYGNAPWTRALIRKRPCKDFDCQEKGIYTVAVNAIGQKVVSGGPMLKSTQHYPALFGKSVYEAFAHARHVPVPDIDDASDASPEEVEADDWDDVGWEGISRVLDVDPHEQLPW
jgi:hypothetical protein